MKSIPLIAFCLAAFVSLVGCRPEQSVTSEQPKSVEEPTVAHPFLQDVEEGKFVILNLGAPWCPPCVIMDPLVDELGTQAGAVVHKVNIDNYPEIAVQYNAEILPIILLFKDSVLVGRLEGLKSKEDLKEAFMPGSN
ncbi:MAG: thioredoxin family protein [Verrucomicrobiota bacterium]